MTREEGRRRAEITARQNDRGGSEEQPARQETGTEGERPRISPSDAFLMTAVAFLFDGAQLFLAFIMIGIVVNPVISVIAWLTFFLWYHAKGMNSSISLRGGMSSIAKNPAMMNVLALLVELVGFNILALERTAATIVTIVAEYARTAAAKRAGAVGRLVGKALT